MFKLLGLKRACAEFLFFWVYMSLDSHNLPHHKKLTNIPNTW